MSYERRTVTASPSATNGAPLGLTGATAPTRYVGGTASGAPASGTFAVGDFVIDQTGKVYICTVAGSPGTWVAVSAGGFTYPGFKSGRWVIPQLGGVSNIAQGINAFCPLPFFVGKTTTFDRIGCKVIAAAGAGGVIRFGIYADDGNGYPGALVLDAGTIDATVTGDAAVTISQSLAPGVYWVGGVAQINGSPTMTCALSSLVYPTSATSITTAFANMAYSQTTSMSGALPANFTGTNTVAYPILCALRAA